MMTPSIISTAVVLLSISQRAKDEKVGEWNKILSQSEGARAQRDVSVTLGKKLVLYIKRDLK